MLTFLTPWWGAAMFAAVGVPLLAHLLSSKGGRLAVFPTVRFVEQAAADVSRLLRPRHWLLMALRMALLGMIVLAFMQPVWRSATAADKADGLLVVLVVDRSASMGRTHRGAALFDEAKRLAIQRLGRLDPSRDLASVILVDHQPWMLLPEPSAHFSELARRLAAVQGSHERGRLDDALRLADSVTDRTAGAELFHRARHLEVFTDAQATSWSAGSIGAASDAVYVHVVEASGDNISVSRPVLMPTRPVIGQPAVLTVEVANYTAEPREIAVEARLDEAAQRQFVKVDPFAVSAAGFSLVFDRVGPAVVEVSLADHAGDAMAADDHTGLVVEVVAARPVTLVTRAAITDSRTAAYFVARAIAPGGGEEAGVQLRVTSPADSALTEPADGTDGLPRVFVLVEAGEIDAAVLEALRQRVATGDGGVWIVDSPAAADALQQFGDSPIVPRIVNAWQQGEPRSLTGGHFDAPVLAVFEGPARSALLRQTFGTSLRGALAPGAEPLLMFENGEPAVASRWLGSGRLTVIAADLSPASTDFGKGPLLVPLLHQMIRLAAPGPPAPSNPNPGQRVNLEVEAGQTMQRPEGGAPGLHAVVDEHTGAIARGVWMELDPAESDLRTAEWVKDVADKGEREQVHGPSQEAVLRPADIELWGYAVLGALLLAGIEMAVLWMSARPSAAGEAAHG